MSLRIGDTAPDFTAETTEGKINFYQWLDGSWGILYSHPSDFTPVCTTELGRTAHLEKEFEKRNTKILAVSVDDLASHNEWIKDINETQQCTVGFPVIADSDRNVATLYGMIHENASTSVTVRSVYFIGTDKKVKAVITYPASTGRNFDEIVRVLDSLQLTAKYSVATPADWKNGEDVIISNSIVDQEIERPLAVDIDVGGQAAAEADAIGLLGGQGRAGRRRRKGKHQKANHKSADTLHAACSRAVRPVDVRRRPAATAFADPPGRARMAPCPPAIPLPAPSPSPEPRFMPACP